MRMLAWRGTISGALSSSPDKITKALNKDLDKMFARFPPQPAAR